MASKGLDRAADVVGTADHRALFDLPETYAFFDNAAFSLPPRVAKEAALAGALRRAEPWRVPGPVLEAEAEEIRTLFATLIGATADDVAIVNSTSFGVSTAAQTLGIGAGEAVLVIDGEHPSVVLPWVEAAARAGAVVEDLRECGDASRTEALIARVAANDKPPVGVLALTPVQWSDGEAIDVVAVANAARARGAKVVVDATQSAGVLPLDLAAVDPDFLVTAGHKWLLGPQGSALLYAAPRHQGGRPIDQHAHARAIDRYAPPGPPGPLPFLPGARRYDSGQRGNMILMPIVRAGLAFVLEIGVETILAHVSAVIDEVAESAERLGFRTLPKARRAPHILALSPPTGTANAIAAELAAEGVFLSARQGLLRVAPHLHTGPREVDRLVDALGRAVGASSRRP